MFEKDAHSLSIVTYDGTATRSEVDDMRDHLWYTYVICNSCSALKGCMFARLQYMGEMTDTMMTHPHGVVRLS